MARRIRSEKVADRPTGASPGVVADGRQFGVRTRLDHGYHLFHRRLELSVDAAPALSTVLSKNGLIDLA